MSRRLLSPLLPPAGWLHCVSVLILTLMSVMGAVLISGGGLNPAAAGACTGDCDNSGQVTVNEILEMVNIALGVDAVPACKTGDANQDGMITVDEILKAVTLALTRCPLTGSGAGEASSGVDESTRDGTDAAGRIIDFGKAGTGGGGSAILSQPGGSDSGGALVSSGCPAGGDLVISSCTTNRGVTTLTVIFNQCREVESQTMATTTGTGTLKLTVADPTVCTTGRIPARAAVTSEFDQFVADRVDPGGRTITQVAVLTDVFQPSGEGCAVENGTDTIDGALSVRHDPAAPAAVYAFHNFVVETSTAPTIGTCITQHTFNGALSVDDPVLLRTFSETVRNFVVTDEPLQNQRVITEDGTLLVDCLGTAKFQSLEPLRIVSGNPCPLGGVLEVTLPDGTTTRAQYSPNGVSFDFNGDGRIDKQVTTCLDPTLAQCTEKVP
jgi:hypothetical protein